MNESVIDKLIEELLELKEIKTKYQCLLADKKQMSVALYILLSEKYNDLPREEKIVMHKEEVCKNCRHRYDCTRQLPEDIWNIVPSDKDFIPGHKTCSDFMWS